MTPYGWANVWLAASLAVIVGHTLLLRAKGRLLLFDPLYTFWGGFVVCNILQPMDYVDDLVRWNGLATYETTLFYSFVGALCVAIGYEGSAGPRVAARLPRLPRRLDPKRFFLAGLVAVAAGAWDFHLQFLSAHGLREWLSWPRGGTDWTKVDGLVGTLEQLVVLGAFLLLLHVNIHPVGAAKKFLAYGYAAALWVWYVYLGTRSRTVTVLMLCAAAYYVPRRRNPPFLAAGVVFLALYVLTNFEGVYRGNFYDLSFHLDRLDPARAEAICLPKFLGGDPWLQRHLVDKGIDFNVDATTVAVVPNQAPFSYGWNLAELVTRWIPHSIWPEKPYPALEAMQGVFRQLTTHQQGDTGLLDGPSITFLAFWYDILGPVAVVLGGLFTGAMFRTLRSILDRDPGCQGDLTFYCTCIGIGFSESASQPLMWLPLYVFVWIPILAIIYYCRVPEEPAPPPWPAT